MPPVAVTEADPAKFGAEVVPLPERVAELVVIMYVPASSVWPSSVSPSVVNVIETDQLTVAE